MTKLKDPVIPVSIKKIKLATCNTCGHEFVIKDENKIHCLKCNSKNF